MLILIPSGEEAPNLPIRFSRDWCDQKGEGAVLHHPFDSLTMEEESDSELSVDTNAISEYSISPPSLVESFEPDDPLLPPNQDPGVRPIPLHKLPSVLFLNEVNFTLFELLDKSYLPRYPKDNQDYSYVGTIDIHPSDQEQRMQLCGGSTDIQVIGRKTLQQYQKPIFRAICKGRSVRVLLDVNSYHNAVPRNLAKILQAKVMNIGASPMSDGSFVLHGAQIPQEEVNIKMRFGVESMPTLKFRIVDGASSTLIMGYPDIRRHYIKLPPEFRAMFFRESGPIPDEILTTISKYPAQDPADQSPTIVSWPLRLGANGRLIVDPTPLIQNPLPNISEQVQARHDAVQNFPTPRSYEELLQFFSLTQFFQSSIPSFRDMTPNMDRLALCFEPFQWTMEEDSEFRYLKCCIASTRPRLPLSAFSVPQHELRPSRFDISEGTLVQNSQREMLLRMRLIGCYDPHGDQLFRVWCERYRHFLSSPLLTRQHRWTMLQTLLLDEANQHARLCCQLGMSLPQTLRSLASSFCHVRWNDNEVAQFQRRASRHFLLARQHQERSIFTKEQQNTPGTSNRYHRKLVSRVRTQRLLITRNFSIDKSFAPSNLYRVCCPDRSYYVQRVLSRTACIIRAQPSGEQYGINFRDCEFRVCPKNTSKNPDFPIPRVTRTPN